jgi:hypothetical protein
VIEPGQIALDGDVHFLEPRVVDEVDQLDLVEPAQMLGRQMIENAFDLRLGVFRQVEARLVFDS